jgi:hypothetical protein
MKKTTPIERLAQYVRERYPVNQSFENMVQNLISEEEKTVSEAWEDGNFLGRNGNILPPYHNGKTYFEHLKNPK